MVKAKQTVPTTDAGDAAGLEFLKGEMFWTVVDLDQDDGDDNNEEDELDHTPDKVM